MPSAEVCNGADDVCDGKTDENGAQGCHFMYKDGDGDGFGDPGSQRCLCTAEEGWQTFSGGGDSDDSDPLVYPGAPNECQANGDCCAPASWCVPRIGRCAQEAGDCSGDDDCPSDYHCDQGKCVPWVVVQDKPYSEECTRPTKVGIFRPALQCKWTSPPLGDPRPNAVNVIPTPVAVDFDFDGDPKVVRPSIVFPTNAGHQCDDPNDYGNGWIRVIDGATCQQQYVITAHEVVAASAVAASDLDLDGRPEIVANAKGGGLVAFRYDTKGDKFVLMWHSKFANGKKDTTAYNNMRWNGPSIFDVTGEAHPEVLMGAMMYDWHGKALTTNLGWKPNVGTGQVPVVADVDSDGKGELVTGNAVYGYQAGTGWVKESYFKKTGLSDGFVALADFGDYYVSGLGKEALPEVVVVGRGEVRVQTLSGQVIFGPITLPYFPPATDTGYGGPPTVGDFDGDGRPEIIASRGCAWQATAGARAMRTASRRVTRSAWIRVRTPQGRERCAGPSTLGRSQVCSCIGTSLMPG